MTRTSALRDPASPARSGAGRAGWAVLIVAVTVTVFVFAATLGFSVPASAQVDGRADAGDVDADAPTVAAHVAPAHAHIGDSIELTITAIARTGIPVNLPNVIELGAFSLLDRVDSQSDLGDGRTRRQFVLHVATYAPGAATIPAVEVTYLGRGGAVRQVRTAPQPVTITSLIANEPEPALKENAAPVSVLRQDLTLVYIAAGLGAAALGGLLTWLVVRRLRRRVSVRPAPPPRPAHEIAMERLDRLGTYGFLENADNRPFYFSVSEIIRDYLGGRFGFDSLELTTDELMKELRARAGRDLVLGDIGGWLSACDLVKFAKVSPTAAESRGTLESAIRIVESSRPRPVVPSNPAPGPMAASGPGLAPPSSRGSSPGQPID